MSLGIESCDPPSDMLCEGFFPIRDAEKEARQHVLLFVELAICERISMEFGEAQHA